MLILAGLIGGVCIFLIILSRFFISTLEKTTDKKIETLRREWGETLTKNTELILGQLNEQMKMSHAMSTSMGERLDNAARVIHKVNESLGSLSEKTQQVYEIGKDIASLQEILRVPKIRGGLGELFLEALLEEIMPSRDFYELQHSFKSGERVDAVIILGKRFVPVDSKFPLESFKRIVDAKTDEDRKRARREFIRAVKDHIDEIASKYIVPEEGTYDFALMYIPAENVYYETIIKDSESPEERSIFSHAISKRVIPVSPNSFYAYLQVIILGIKGMKIEEKAQEVIEALSALRGGFEKFREDFSVLGTHIEHLRSSYEKTEKDMDRFEHRLLSLDAIEDIKKIEDR